MSIFTLIVFLVVFGGMIFLHELGHFLAARFFKIPVEEFGFGLPPRIFTFWREKGYLVINGKRVEIPSRFRLNFDRLDLIHKQVTVTAEPEGEKLVIRSLELMDAPTKASVPSAGGLEILPQNVGGLSLKLAQPREERGSVELTGRLTEMEPGTEFTLNALPLGGFVRPRGESDPNLPDGLAAANPWKRLVVLAAGPIMNLLTAVVVYAIIVGQTGVAVTGKVMVQSVSENSPASQAGFQSQDIIVKINGQPVADITTARQIIRGSLDKPVSFEVERASQMISIIATPSSTRTVEQGALGVQLNYPYRPATLGEAISGGVTMTGIQAVGILSIPVALFGGLVSPDEARLIGLKGIYDTFGAAIQRDTETRQAVEASPSSAPGQPTNYTLFLIGMLSVSLGIMNLLPIPALDGGRILFTLPEILFRKRIPHRLENVINGVAFLLLIGLMLVVNLMDFIKPVNINLP